jgi:hypothetical protein
MLGSTSGLGPAGIRSRAPFYCFFLHDGINPEFNSPLSKNTEPQDEQLSVVMLAMSVVTLGVPALSHGKMQAVAHDEQKPELRDIKGSVKSTDGKITFIADEGGKTWDVVNPDALKDHVRHHVQLSADVYTDKSQIHVMTVTML